MGSYTEAGENDEGGGAPANVHVLTTQAEAGLSAESNLGLLTTGLVKITVSGAVATPSTAVPVTDYVASLSDATPANVGTAAAGAGTSASRADHVHALPDVVSGATKGGSAKLIRSVQYDAKGRFEAAATEVDLGALATGLLKNTTTTGALSIAAAGTDYRAVDDDVISRQTLGGDTPDITIAVADTDERVEIDFYGPTTAGDITLQVNGGGTPVTNGGTIQTSGGAVSGSTARMIANYTGPLSFRLVLDIKNLGLHRTGLCWAVSKNTGSTARDLDFTAVVWPDAAANVTSLVLHSSVATGFKSGCTVIARRKKIT